MKEIYTSYYANIRKLPRYIEPLGISVGKNKYFPMLRYDLRLAPTFPMLRMPREEYDKRMRARLERLDAEQVYNSFPDKVALICYEKYNDWCHRRMVAEWLEDELGIVVPEYGLKREESFPYAELSKETKGKKRKVNELVGNRADQIVIDEFHQQKEVKEEMPESVRIRLESYKKENERIDLFNYQNWED